MKILAIQTNFPLKSLRVQLESNLLCKSVRNLNQESTKFRSSRKQFQFQNESSLCSQLSMTIFSQLYPKRFAWRRGLVNSPILGLVTSQYMEVSSNRGTPSHHPFLDGIFICFPWNKPALGVPPWLWKRPNFAFHIIPCSENIIPCITTHSSSNPIPSRKRSDPDDRWNFGPWFVVLKDDNHLHLLWKLYVEICQDMSSIYSPQFMFSKLVITSGGFHSP